MSRIRSRDTKPELLLRKSLWGNGLRYRLNYRILEIHPDIVFLRQKVAVFVDGCQWHGCPQHYVAPRTRSDFWQEKLRQNVFRDSRQTRTLQEASWTVIRIWEHEIWESLDDVVNRVRKSLQGICDDKIEDWRVFRVEFSESGADLETRNMCVLQDPSVIQVICQTRSTKKWSRKLHQVEK